MKNKYVFVATLLLVMSALSFTLVKLTGKPRQNSHDYVIVTSFYPVYIAAINVTEGVENVTVRNLTEPSTGCLHDYQLTAGDLKSLEQADLLLINGGGMESFLDDVIKQFPELIIIDSSHDIVMLPSSEAENNEIGIQEHVHEELEDEHEHGSENAHIWLNIEFYEQQINTIEEALCQLDAKNADNYHQNAAQYIEKLDKLNKEAEAINGESAGAMILFHDAFAYIAQMCGFETAKIINMDEETALSAADVGEAVNLAKTQSVSFLLSDETYGKKTAQLVAQESGAKVIYLDPLVSGAYDKDAYLQGMEKNLKQLQEALLWNDK